MWSIQQIAQTGSATVEVVPAGECYACLPHESLLHGMLRMGRRGIPAGCINGGCGVCKVRIVAGSIRLLGPVSRQHVNLQEEAQGYTLACRAAPVGNIRLEVCQKLAKAFSRPPPDLPITP